MADSNKQSMIYGKITEEIQNQLKNIVGEENFHLDEETLRTHASDETEDHVFMP